MWWHPVPWALCPNLRIMEWRSKSSQTRKLEIKVKIKEKFQTRKLEIEVKVEVKLKRIFFT